jgi:OOP family OmpA-OmpF porin
MKFLSRITLAAIACLSMPAFAQSNWYGGFGLGWSETDKELVTNRSATGGTVNVVDSAFDEKDSGYRIFAGYRFLSWLSVEANYSDLGETRLLSALSTSTSPPVTGGASMTRKLSGFGVDAVLTAPLTNESMIFGRVGVVRSRLEIDESVEVSIPGLNNRTSTVSESITRFGFGAEWMFTRNLGARLEWERWLGVGKKFEATVTGRTLEADTDFYSLNLVYRY